MPWSGHSAAYALPDIYQAIRSAGMALVFTNTRSQSERIFHELWTLNEDALPIALHHGSLDVSQRRKVEAAMAAGSLRAVVCTSTLDLGIDWGDVDLVINVGAPKGSSRILQRIGRANHRYEEPSRALLVPSNRFEVLECEAARIAAFEGAQDGDGPAELKRDVLAQHIMGSAVAAPFDPDGLYAEITSAWPCCAAMQSGVKPCGPGWSTTAPAASSTEATAAWPLCAAKKSGVVPSTLAAWFTAAPADRSSCGIRSML